MKIKEQLVFSNNKIYGTVDMGTNMTAQNESATKASYALVFMAVALNGHWKVPLGYFLIKSLTGTERANILRKCLELLYESNVHVHSLTFDGASTNISMSSCFGANLDILSSDFKPWFINPWTSEKIFIFLDACHMIKLVRNVFGDFKILQHDKGLIKWEYIEKLISIQRNEGLHAANKLGIKHLNYNDNRMSVKLAVQTLSLSTAKALEFMKLVGYKDFEDSKATVEFCEIFNNAFDLLNVRSRYSKKNDFHMPLTKHNMQDIKVKIVHITKYIINLKDKNGQQLLLTPRKTAFQGIVASLKNMLDLFTTLSAKGIEYLLTFKLSQDAIETFFSAIRSRGGFNNNPNAQQFESAYKRLLIKHEIGTSNSNCLADGIEILHASSRRAEHKMQSAMKLPQTINFEHDYVKVMWTLSPFVDNVMKYIAGFIVHKILKSRQVTCEVCTKHLFSSGSTSSYLSILKNRGSYLHPSTDVVYICS